MFKIFTDHQTTRRQRLHFVVEGRETVVFSSKDLASCLDWLRETGAIEAQLIGRKTTWHITFAKVSGAKGHLDEEPSPI
jgi:hypothetical protein